MGARGADAGGDTLVRTSGFAETWPEGLLDGVGPATWLVVRSLPRQEKRLVADCRARGIPGCFFGERRLRHYRGKGSQETRVPLFPGYIFAAPAPGDRAALLATGRVQTLLPVPQPRELTSELRDLALLLARSDGAPVVRPELAVGDRVQVTSGSLAGCQGILVRRRGRDELVVNLEALGSSVSTRLSAYTVEAV